MMNELPLVLLIMLLIAVMLRLDFIFYLIYVMAGVYIMARWWPARSMKHIRVRRLFSDHAFLGETVPVDLEDRKHRLAAGAVAACGRYRPAQFAGGQPGAPGHLAQAQGDGAPQL